MGLKLPSNKQLSDTEKEILRLLVEEFFTIKQISQRRQTSIQAVYKLIRSIKKKGYLGQGFKGFKKIEPTYNKTDIRLHGQEINVRIIFQNPKYQELLEKSNVLFLDGNTIRLYKNSIELYCGQSFYGKTTDEADRKSLEYIQKFLLRLENDLKVCLIKNRARNIKVVNQHYARGDSELSDKANEEKKRIWVYAEEDGKLAFITDDSFGFKEDETVHPITAKKDRNAVDKQVNDWRLYNPPTNSELAEGVNGLILVQKQEAIKWGEYAKHIKSHTESIKILGKEIKGLSRVIRGLKKENSDLKLEIKNQKTLGEY